jgi:hypothetical protein
MTSLVMVRSLCVVLCFAGLATAQEPPPLEPPDQEPPKASAPRTQPETTSKPARPKPAAPTQPGAAQAVNPRPAPGPMLAIPGVTAPIARPRPATRPQPATPSQTAVTPFASRIDAPPAQSAAPATRRPSSSNGTPPLDPLPRPSSREEIPLTIEPPIVVPFPEQAQTSPLRARPATGRTTGAGATDPPSQEKRTSAPRPAPRRMPGILGRLFGPPPPQPSREPVRNTPRATTSRESDIVSDAELVARRRIERQIRDTLGDRVSHFEVRITGRNAVIVAQPSRFWYRRSVRRSLETLPALEGYRARIELSD